MKILVFVDLHGNKSSLKHLINRSKKKDVALVVCAGDFTIFGEQQDLLLAKLDKIGKPVLMVHGNHEDEDSLKKSCKATKHCKFIHNSTYKHDHYLFIGWGGGGFSYVDRELQKNFKRLKNFAKKEKKIVFVTHAPPYNTKIDNIHNEHAGNKTIRKFIEAVKPILSISGHLHECTGKDKIGKTEVINPGYKGKVLVI